VRRRLGTGVLNSREQALEHLGCAHGTVGKLSIATPPHLYDMVVRRDIGLSREIHEDENRKAANR